MKIKLLLANLRLYSVQAIAFLASLNTFYLSVLAINPDSVLAIPAWIVMTLNVAGLLYGYIGRGIPQPEALARVESLR